MKNFLFSLIVFIAFGFIGKAQNVNIPDANFKAYLLGNTAINTNSDSEIQVSEASAYMGFINCQSLGITDLTGIEAFTGIWSLTCYANSLTSLDVSQNTALTTLLCNANSLTSLNLSQNTALTRLECNHNALTSLDLSNNSALTWMYLYNNQLEYVNVANGNNANVTAVNFTGNPNLTCIQVDDSTYSANNWPAPTFIDPSMNYSANCPCTVNIPDANFKAYLVGNTAINTNNDAEIQCSEASAYTGGIYCSASNISDMTGIEAFTSITELICFNNQITTLDLSNNPDLNFIRVENNLLTSLDVSNCTNLDDLRCEINQLISLDVSNSPLLATLLCHRNNITDLDLSSNPTLSFLHCHTNDLSSLNMANGNNTAITNFQATVNPNLTCIQVDDSTYSANNWTSIDAASSFSENCAGGPCIVSIPDANFKAYLVGNTAINTNNDTEIQCSEASAFSGTITCNSLGVTDMTGLEAFTALTELQILYEGLANLDVSSNVNLTVLDCYNNTLSTLDLSNNPNLVELRCQKNSIVTLDLSNLAGLTFLSCSDNDLTALDISNNTLLTELYFQDNQVTSINFSNNTLLERISANNNAISTLDVSNQGNLTYLSLYSCNLTSVDLTNNNAIEYLTLSYNPISSLNLSNLLQLTTLYISGTDLTQVDASLNTQLTGIDTYECLSLNSLNVANGNNQNFISFESTDCPNLSCIEVDDVAYSTANWTNIDSGTSFSTNCSSCTVNIPDAAFKAYLVGNTAINTNNDAEIQCSEASAYSGGIDCSNLSISDLTGIEAFTAIISLNCSDNSLTSVDISNNPLLETFSAENNSLAALDISNCPDLTYVNIQFNDVSSFTRGTHNSLQTFYATDNDFTSIDLSNLPAVYTISVQNSFLTSINVMNCPSLAYLYIKQNSLSTIDLSSNINLESFTCSNNQFTSFDFSGLQFLGEFIGSNNQLTSLNIANGNNSNIATNYFKVENNPSLTCITVDDVAYSTSNWTNIDLGVSFSANCGVVAPVLVNSITVQGQGGGSTITTSGGTLQMEAAVLPANADDATYTWSVTNGTGSATISSTGLLTATADGTVEVTATANDTSGVSGSKTITISNQTVGINDLAFENIKVYPNPTNGVLNIQLSGEELSQIRILDMAGKTIQVLSPKVRQVNISHLEKGIYFLEVSNKEAKGIFKVLKL